MKNMTRMIFAFLLAGTATAAPSRWYIGGNIQYHLLREPSLPGSVSAPDFVATSLWPFTDSPSGGEYHNGLGFQVEGGLMDDLWSAFVGYRQTYARYLVRTDSPGPFLGAPYGYKSGNTLWWYGSRFMMGGRLHMPVHSPQSLQPILGAGMSCGWLRRTEDSFSTYNYPYPQSSWSESSHLSQTSKITLGWFGEAGLLYYTGGPFAFTATVRYDDLRLLRDFTWPNGINGDYTELAFQIGTIYLFGK